MRNEIKTNDTKNNQECGKTAITGRAMFDAQPSSVITCNKANSEDPRSENSIKTSPNRQTAIIAKT